MTLNGLPSVAAGHRIGQMEAGVIAGSGLHVPKSVKKRYAKQSIQDPVNLMLGPTLERAQKYWPLNVRLGTS